MDKTFFAVREVDEKAIRKFKALAVEERMKLGDALTKAMLYWLAKEKKDKKKAKGVDSLLKIKPFNWGPGTEKTSSEIDEILYGLKK